MPVRWIVITVLVFLLLIVVVQNAEVVTVRLLFWQFSMSRVILILLAAVTGFVAGWAGARLADRNRRRSEDPGAGF